MGLFSKKPPCPICGGKISWFLPWKIEDNYICDTCYSKIDMQSEKERNLTMQGFQEYLAFYDENQLLKDKFVISERFDFDLWDTKIIFDYQNRLFCMSKDRDKTVFEGKHLKSFTIKEDSTLIFEGSADGIQRYTSTIPERAMALAPQITQFLLNRQLTRTMDKMDDGKENYSVATDYFNISEPFRDFKVELYLDHPYWSVIKFNLEGPRFSSDHPDVNEYIFLYQRCIDELERLVAALKIVAFPEAQEQSIYYGTVGAQLADTNTTNADDVIEEIKKYKALMEEGIITQEEFEAKKKQLLGI